MLTVCGVRRSTAGIAAAVAWCALPQAALAQSSPDTGRLTWLGTIQALPASSYGYAVSGDGSVAVGASDAGGGVSHAFRWTSAGGMADLGTIGGARGNSAAYGVSGDGSIVAGASINLSGVTDAFRWTAAGGMMDLGTIGGAPGGSSAYGISTDGSTIAGASATPSGGSHAFLWTSGGGFTDLGSLAGSSGSSAALGVNSNGSVAVGDSGISGSSFVHAFRWTSGGGMADLGTIGGYNGNSYAYAVNASGATVVGTSQDAAAYTHAFIWDAAGGMRDIGTIGYAAGNSTAYAVSADGSIIVGTSQYSLNSGYHAFRFAAGSATGPLDLNTLLASAGVNMTGVTLTTANGISANGQYITGTGTFSGSASPQAYIASYGAGGTVAGVTTPASLQTSINVLATTQSRTLIQSQLKGGNLLGDNQDLSAGTEVSAFTSLDSADGGAASSVSVWQNLRLLWGVSGGEASYKGANVTSGVTLALGLRYVYDIPESDWHPFGEIAGWWAPQTAMQISRPYANGAGVSLGKADTDANSAYGFGRAGVAYRSPLIGELAISAELGRQWSSLHPYAETLSAANPFPMTLLKGATSGEVVKLRVQETRPLTAKIEAGLWLAGARGFGTNSDTQAAITGAGVFRSVSSANPEWAEYGARLGYRIRTGTLVSVSVSGMSGDHGIGTKYGFGADVRYKF
jgi:probable HAF family extracellular repeat protein